MGQLTERNREIHERQDKLLLDVYEACTLLDFAEAAHLLAEFERDLFSHMTYEETNVFVHYENDKNSDPKDLLVKQCEGDHKILKRSLASARELINRLKESELQKQRRELVANFDDLLRVRRVLEHHTARECRDLYPRLEIVVDEREQKHMVGALNGGGPGDQSLL